MIRITVTAADGSSATLGIGLEANATGGLSVLAARFDEAKFDQADYD